MKTNDLNERFLSHVPSRKHNVKHNLIGDAALDLAKKISILCPETKEKYLAITKIEEAQMWAHSAISRMQRSNDKNKTEEMKNGN